MGGTIPERVAQIYYTYGLFISSYPTTAITLAISIVLICCYPLLNVPLPGNDPTVVKVPVAKSYEVDNAENDGKPVDCDINNSKKSENTINLKHMLNETQKLPYIWVKEKPYLYVQQIILKTGVSPWNSNLRMWDAFRSPLQEVFKLLETIRNHQDPIRNTTLTKICYQIDGIKRKDSTASVEPVLPEYSCLVLSPANLWQQNLQTYALDTNIISTIFNHQNLYRGKVSIAEMAFGMHLKDAGIKRYPLRSRARVLQYAVTIFYEEADNWFINSLSEKLKKIYPLHQDEQYTVGEATLIYYPGKWNCYELIPLVFTFLVLFIYMYFSVRKIEFIKSKFGLAACAVLTIAASLSMSMGLCFYFGFSLSLQGKEIVPFLVIIVGLENVLVLTKSVTATDRRLDVKIRLAQGLSKEGWSITKNLMTEITVFTLSFFTFVPFIQEFSIFMIVSLVSDCFIQMVFFATILGIDVRRMELFREQNNKLHLKEYLNFNNALNWQYTQTTNHQDHNHNTRMIKSRSHPRLNIISQTTHTDIVAKRMSICSSAENKVPKRIKLVNLWARTRFFQRAFMLWMIVWISMITYNSGAVGYFINDVHKTQVKREANRRSDDKILYKKDVSPLAKHTTEKNSMIFSSLVNIGEEQSVNGDNEKFLFLRHSQPLRPWARLPVYHWSSILTQYNESLAGKYIVILPPQLLSCRISPDMAVSVRNPDEKELPPLRWQALAAALDPIDIAPEFDIIDSMSQTTWNKALRASELPIYPTTPMELLLLAILCIISIIVIAYMMVVLYRCVCSRNYAEWRASWTEDKEYLRIIAKQPALQLVMEAVPTIVPGHAHEIECIVTNGEKIVSSCLQGTVKVWDAQDGELLNRIDRRQYFKLQKEIQEKSHLKENKLNNSDFAEPLVIDFKNSYENVPRLRNIRKNVKLDFPLLSEKYNLPSTIAEKTKYHLARTYKDYNTKKINDKSYNNHEYKENIDIINRNNNANVDKRKPDNNYVTLNTSPNKRLTSNNMKNVCNENNNVIHRTSSTNAFSAGVTNAYSAERTVTESPIWCMDYYNDLIILGCADGRLEFWDIASPKLMCVWWNTLGEPSSQGITQVSAVGAAMRICVAILSGHLVLLRLDTYNPSSGVHVDWSFSSAHRRTHKRTGSVESIHMQHNNAEPPLYFDISSAQNTKISNCDDEILCTRVVHCRAHQQPITKMYINGGRILTGGQDHVVKIFSCGNLTKLFALHGHCGPITSCFIDHVSPTIGGSGSQDGLLCVWDLHSGACLYSMQAHIGAVTSLAYTASYVISSGSDERLCIWDRFQGHMLNSIHIGVNYMSNMLPLTHSLLLMGGKSSLTIYDLSNGDIARRVLLGQQDGTVFVRQILPLRDAIVCDYAHQLRIVRFPLISQLSDTKKK